jgi:catechol 2,3-dioxygenase-like lactoylglutathione lyase family enzyme
VVVGGGDLSPSIRSEGGGVGNPGGAGRDAEEEAEVVEEVVEEVRMRLAATSLDAPDARELAGFYRRLLGWEVAEDEPGWVTLRPPGGRGARGAGAGLSFQTEPAYRRPVRPAGPGDPQMSMHLDFEVNDLAAAGARAEAARATLAEFQPQEDVRVYLDPAGHPFCLFLPY